MVAAVEDGSGLVLHEILLSRLGGPWQQEGGYLRLALRLLRLALLTRLPLQVQVNGLARRLRLHGRSVRGGFAAIQPLHQAMLQVRRRVVFTRGLLAGLDEFFKDGQSLLAADAVVGQYLPHVVQGLEHASPHSHGVRKDGRQHQVRCRLARLALALGSSRHRRLSQSLLLEQIVTLLKASCV